MKAYCTEADITRSSVDAEKLHDAFYSKLEWRLIMTRLRNCL